jgi:hypothetical protein
MNFNPQNDLHWMFSLQVNCASLVFHLRCNKRSEEMTYE